MRTLAEANLNSRDRAAVLETVAALRAALPIDEIVLYGSTARGDAGPDSDIDLLILTTRPLSAAESDKLSRIVYPIQLNHRVLLSPLVVASEDWYRGIYQAMPLRVEVDRDGIAA